MSICTLQVGDYGNTITFTCYDCDDTVLDVSGYSSLEVNFTNRKGVSITRTAGFVTDGSDGLIIYTFASGDLSTVGDWKGQVKLSNGSAVIHSNTIDIKVLANI